MPREKKPIDKLDIYVECQTLIKLIYEMQFTLNKKDRLALYPFLIDKSLKIPGFIAKAKRCKEIEYQSLQEMIAAFEEIKMILRIMIDEKIITSDSIKIRIFTSICAIDRNLDKWYSYKSDQVNKKIMSSKQC